MVDAQTGAEDALQALHHLNGQGYFGQQVEHLLVALQGLLYQVDVELRLTARRDAVQQGDVLLHHLHEDGVIGVALCLAERLDEVRTIVAAMVQSTYLHLIAFQHLALLQLLDGLRRGTAGIHQFFTGHSLHSRRGVGDLVPARQLQIGGKCLQLLSGPCQHVQRNVQGCYVAVLLRQSDVRFRLRAVAVLGLQSCRQGCLIDLTDRRQVVVAYPRPQAQLHVGHYRRGIDRLQQRFHLVAHRLLLMHPHHDAEIGLGAPEGHEDTLPHPDVHALRHGVGECPRKGYGQYHVGIHHRVQR